LKFRQRRNPIEHNAGTHHIENLLIERKCARTLQYMRFVISRNGGAKLFYDLAKSQKLLARVLRVLIRNRQMRRDTVNPDLPQRRNFLEKCQGFVLRNAHAAHSRVDLKIDSHRRVARHPIEIPCFFKSGNRRDETALRNCRSFFRQGWTKNHDWMSKHRAQLNRFLQIRDAE
jgi:hypothetical protein